MRHLLWLISLLFLFSVVQAQQPSISALSPASGPVGAQVTITGANFSPTAANNTVYFGAVKATVLAATTNSLTVTVPLGATNVPVSVAVNNLIAYSKGSFAVTYAGGGVNFSASSFAPAAWYSGNGSVTSGDFDGDGKVDVVSTDFSNNIVTVHRNTSSGSAVTFSNSPLGGAVNPLSTNAADFDGDGKLDLVVAGYYWGVVYVFKNNSTPGIINFAASQWFAAGSSTRKVATGDIDGDGKVDIIASNENPNTISVLRNTSSATTLSFAAKIDLATGVQPEGVCTGDLDGDGKPEIMVACKESDAVSVFRNTSTPGNIALSAKTDYPTGDYPWDVAAVDMDGDGKLELLSTNGGPDNVSVFRNTSTTEISFAPRVDFATSYTPKGMTVSDLDADGKPEIITANSYWQPEVCVLRNTSVSGTLSFNSYVAYATAEGPISVAAADFNADGLTDLITANSTSRSLSFLRNQLPIVTTVPRCPQLMAPVNNAVLNYGMPQELKWRKEISASGYRLKISIQQTGAVSEITTTDTSYLYTPEAGGLNYTWSVTPVNMLDPNTVCASNAFSSCPATPLSATISAAGATDKCSFDSVLLRASPGANFQWFLNNQPIAGATADSIWAKQPGSYTIRQSGGSCFSDPSNTITINNLATPPKPALNVSGVTTFCQGGSVTFTSSLPHTNNQWFKNATAIDGANGDSYAATEGGRYYLRVSNSNSGCQNFSEAVNVVVNATPAKPEVTVHSGATTFCAGDSVTLSSSATSGNQWYKNNTLIAGATSQLLVAHSAGMYTVRVTQNTCSSEFSAATSVVVNPTPAAPAITLYGSSIFCEGDSATLHASVATGIQWYKDNAPIAGAVSQLFVVKEAGVYTVRVIATPCNSNYAPVVRITTNPRPAKPQIAAAAGMLSTATGFQSYNWFFNNTQLSGATTHQYAPTQSGMYKVEVSNEWGCKITSDAFNYVMTALNEVTIAGQSIQVYPNPVIDEVTINVTGTRPAWKTAVAVTDMVGNTLKTAALKNGVNTLSLKELPAGTYHLVIQNGQAIKSVKVFKVH